MRSTIQILKYKKFCTILLWSIIISFGYKGNNYTSLKQFFAARKEKRMQTYLNNIKLKSVRCRALLCWNKKLLWFFVIACSCLPRRNYFFLTKTKLSSNFNMPILKWQKCFISFHVVFNNNIEERACYLTLHCNFNKKKKRVRKISSSFSKNRWLYFEKNHGDKIYTHFK